MGKIKIIMIMDNFVKLQVASCKLQVCHRACLLNFQLSTFNL